MKPDTENDIENLAIENIDFDFYDITKADKESMNILFQTYLPKNEELVEEILKSKLGSLIKADEEVLSAIGAIAMSSVPNDILPEIEVPENSYFIPYARLVNMPWQTTVPLYRLLLEDKSLSKISDFVICCKCEEYKVQKKANKRAKLQTEFLHCEDEILFEDIKIRSLKLHKKEGRLFGIISKTDLLSKIEKIEQMQ
eukprot:NODE_380_length_8387_cov_0.529440.p5 type:complete len:198 gc:universal NODE_380_length_8387_cov_0.529440:6061-6654(+)